MLTRLPPRSAVRHDGRPAPLLEPLHPEQRRWRRGAGVSLTRLSASIPAQTLHIPHLRLILPPSHFQSVLSLQALFFISFAGWWRGRDLTQTRPRRSLPVLIMSIKVLYDGELHLRLHSSLLGTAHVGSRPRVGTEAGTGGARSVLLHRFVVMLVAVYQNAGKSSTGLLGTKVSTRRPRTRSTGRSRVDGQEFISQNPAIAIFVLSLLGYPIRVHISLRERFLGVSSRACAVHRHRLRPPTAVILAPLSRPVFACPHGSRSTSVQSRRPSSTAHQPPLYFQGRLLSGCSPPACQRSGL